MDAPDADRLRGRIEEVAGERAGAPVAVTALAPLAGGACQDNWRVELEVAGGELAGAHRLVLRSDAQRSLPGSLGRREEFAVIEAARRAGTRTPTARWLTDGLVRPGAWAYFLDWADGEAIGRKVLRNPELAAARARLPEELAAELARIHTVTPATAPGLPLPPRGVGGAPDPAVRYPDPVDADLAAQRAFVDELPEPHPAIELALGWLDRNRPSRREVVLCHGDFRVGNFLVAPGGLTGVLDWEFAHWGDPMDDLGWICVRDWRFGQIDKPVGGLCDRARFYAAYEQASGRTVAPRDVRFWELMGNVRWAIGALCQGERYLSGAESDVELVAIGRRANEMEYEALRIIEAAEREG